MKSGFGKIATPRCDVKLEGELPKGFPRATIAGAARYFALRSASRCGMPFRHVDVVFQDDSFSAEVHGAIFGDPTPTDVITQRYDPVPPEPDGVYGELYVNVQRALSYALGRPGRKSLDELLLYIAHGMDHLSGEDDADEAGRARMRRRELGWIRDLKKTEALG